MKENTIAEMAQIFLGWMLPGVIVLVALILLGIYENSRLAERRRKKKAEK